MALSSRQYQILPWRGLHSEGFLPILHSPEQWDSPLYMQPLEICLYPVPDNHALPNTRKYKSDLETDPIIQILPRNKLHWSKTLTITINHLFYDLTYYLI
jgi:hypothetical protein